MCILNVSFFWPHAHGPSCLLVWPLSSPTFFLLCLGHYLRPPSWSHVPPSSLSPVQSQANLFLSILRLLGSVLYSTLVSTMPMFWLQLTLGHSASEYTAHKTNPNSNWMLLQLVRSHWFGQSYGSTLPRKIATKSTHKPAPGGKDKALSALTRRETLKTINFSFSIPAFLGLFNFLPSFFAQVFRTHSELILL